MDLTTMLGAVEHFSSLRIGRDLSMPEGRSYFAHLFTWDYATRVGCAYKSSEPLPGSRFGQIGQTTPEEAIAIVLEKVERDLPDDTMRSPR